MKPIYPIMGFFISLILLFWGYLIRKKPLSKVFVQSGYAVLFISMILFFWWGIMRVIGEV